MTPNPPNNPASPAEASPTKISILDGFPATLSDEEMLARMPALQEQLAEDEALVARSHSTAFLDAFSNELNAKIQKSKDQTASLEKWLEDVKQKRALAEALPQQHPAAEPAPVEAPVAQPSTDLDPSMAALDAELDSLKAEWAAVLATRRARSQDDSTTKEEPRS
jgi:hypothetical protein